MTDLRLALIVEAVDQFSGVFRRMGEAAAGPARSAREHFAKLQEQLSGVTGQFAGLAAIAGGGWELSEIIGEQDAFHRLGIDAGVTGGRIEELRRHIYATAEGSSVKLDQLEAAFREVFARVGLDQAESSLDALATTIERLGGHGDELGKLFGTLQQVGKLKGPNDLIQGMATLRAQIGPHGDWMADFASFAPEALKDYEFRFQVGGLHAMSDLGAVYAALRPFERTTRGAATATEEFFKELEKPDFAVKLQNLLGVNVLGRTPEEADANFHTGFRRPASEWFPQFVDAINRPENQGLGLLNDLAFGTEFRDMLAKLSGGDVAAKFGATGDPAAFMREAAEAANSMTSALNRLNTSLVKVADEVAPLGALADLLGKYPKLTADVVIGLGAFAVAGVAAGWIKNLLPVVGTFGSLAVDGARGATALSTSLWGLAGASQAAAAAGTTMLATLGAAAWLRSSTLGQLREADPEHRDAPWWSYLPGGDVIWDYRGRHRTIDGGRLGGSAGDITGWFQQHGWSHAQALGIAANLQAESGFNPAASGDHGAAYGIAQWHADRQAAFAAWAGHPLQGSSLAEQLGFIQHELEGSESGAGGALRRAGSAADAARVFSKLYERPAGGDAEAAKRAEIAVRFENAPPGTRVTAKSDPGTNIDLDLGYAMGMP